jgi:Ras-related protein Rab-5C
MAQREVKLCLMGEQGVGKSCIVNRYVKDTFSDNMESTIGAAYLSKVTPSGIHFKIWDTAGQERYYSLAPIYYRSANAALIVYDITSKSSFETCRRWVDELQKYAPADTLLYIVGNKCDLESMREVDKESAQVFARENKALWGECSAKSGAGVAAVFDQLASRLLESMQDVQLDKPAGHNAHGSVVLQPDSHGKGKRGASSSSSSSSNGGKNGGCC